MFLPTKSFQVKFTKLVIKLTEYRLCVNKLWVKVAPVHLQFFIDLRLLAVVVDSKIIVSVRQTISERARDVEMCAEKCTWSIYVYAVW